MSGSNYGGIFDATFDESKGLLDTRFLKNDVQVNMSTPNLGKKLMGMIFVPLAFILVLMIMLTINISFPFFGVYLYSSGVKHFIYILIVINLLILVGILTFSALYRTNIPKYIMLQNLVFTFEFVLISMFNLFLELEVLSLLNLGLGIALLVCILQFSILGIFLYNKHQSVKSVLYTSSKFKRIASEYTKKIAQYSFPVLVIFIVAKSILGKPISASGLSLEYGRIIAAIFSPVLVCGGIYFGISYCFYNMFLSYYYLNKYRDKYDLEKKYKEAE
ncbi:hypothetical protein [Companilactobacillus mishanensis]|uniref:Uncharacterized protein n=1 Tax=Companilactobacillus mishanensis TaxID=2486008 RepID=A0A5P0ZLK0_9LACO|nr:hypothetical protein [Companilactobacillus mishanensis]MQS53547.1 hypothetical protein [Companilactobacillus mishanensis]